MNLYTATSLLGTTLFGALAANVLADEENPIIISGSGTTNPSKCFWHIMAKLEEQIKIPVRMTYRAVGSGTGQKEFLGKGIDIDGTITDTEIAYNDFGSGDIPISAADKEKWNNNGIEFAQLPFVLSAVSFFHNIPGVPNGEMGLNMTACLLARVFSADITEWDHPDIKEINPGLNVEENYPIYVGRRDLGSSSTYSITHYLHAQCPESPDEPKGWPEDKAASKIEWDPTTNACDGSGPMTTCIRENEGAIGYIDAAHGHEADLKEIKLKNGDGFFLTSKEAGIDGVQAAAADLSTVPSTAFGDFTNVAYYNMKGPKTWPISLVSYVYIRKDLSHITNPVSRTLLKAFATALFDPDYIGLCERYGHIPVPAEVKDISMAGIAELNWDATEDQEWTFEKKTSPGWGQGDYVISKKRKSFGLYEADRLADDMQPLMEDLADLKAEMAVLKGIGLSSGSAVVNMAWGVGALIGAVMLSLY
eukprot:CAMPEP_0196133156 /NCGR_PEP_ID=MMETSP0910-20130528/2492_1 /TAXON_ID=49265 /ORGANISM="Thalassiosira rotula, Strain GSO102" /LENGTH=476 /DNA_ID=CAMNT_0041392851 /DNA_START=76 /DNA_END=1506 /DNA_ORIENTATION=+